MTNTDPTTLGQFCPHGIFGRPGRTDCSPCLDADVQTMADREALAATMAADAQQDEPAPADEVGPFDDEPQPPEPDLLPGAFDDESYGTDAEVRYPEWTERDPSTGLVP